MLLAFSGISYGQFQTANYQNEPHNIITNNEGVEDILDEFFDSAAYYKVDFVPGLLALKSVKLSPGDRNFIGSNIDGEILINDKLVYYPNLMRWVLFNQLGQHYGLQLIDTELRHIMYNKLELTPRLEYYAEALRMRNTQKIFFFQQLQKKLPLTRRI